MLRKIAEKRQRIKLDKVLNMQKKVLVEDFANSDFIKKQKERMDAI